MKLKVWSGLFVTVCLALLLAGCSVSRGAVEPRWLVLVTTQELEDSGLLDTILPPFEQSTGVRVKHLPLTTAKALDYARLAGVDVLLLPAGPAFDTLAGPAPTIPPYRPEPYPTPTALAGPAPEPSPQPLNFLYNERRLALWSQLVLVAPPTDPAKTKSTVSVVDALKNVTLVNARFYAPKATAEPGLVATVERLWKTKGFNDAKSRGTGYQEIDGDVGTVLRQAASDQAYTIVPLSLFQQSQSLPWPVGTKGRLDVGFSGDLALYLPYEAVVPNNTGPQAQDRDVKLARSLVSYLTNQQAQTLIVGFNSPRTTFKLAPYRPYYFPVFVPGN